MKDSSIKYDLDTPLEKALVWSGFIFVAAAIVLFLMGSMPSKSGPPIKALLPYSLVALVIAIQFFIVRWNTDCYYIVHAGDATIDYHFKVLFYETVTPFLQAENIEAVAVSGEVCHSKRSTWIEYSVQVVTKDGASHRFSDGFRDDTGLLEANQRGHLLAEILDRPFEECEQDEAVAIHGGPGNVVIDRTSAREVEQGKIDAITLPTGCSFVFFGGLILGTLIILVLSMGPN